MGTFGQIHTVEFMLDVRMQGSARQMLTFRLSFPEQHPEFMVYFSEV